MVYAAHIRCETRGRPCVLRVENKAAVAAPIRGRSTPNLSAVLVSLFRNAASRGNTRRIEYAHAQSNSADYPSRHCMMPTEAARSPSEGILPDGPQKHSHPGATSAGRQSYSNQNMKFTREKIQVFAILTARECSDKFPNYKLSICRKAGGVCTGRWVWIPLVMPNAYRMPSRFSPEMGHVR